MARSKVVYHDWTPNCPCGFLRALHKPHASGKNRPSGPSGPSGPPGKSKFRKDRGDRESRLERMFGVDGEGRDDENGKHRYIYLAVADEQGYTDGISNSSGLRTHECLDFLLRQPMNATYFGFGFGYDRTMILRDLPDHLIWRLMRPDKRSKMLPSGHVVPANVYWSPMHSDAPGQPVYVFGYMGSQLTVRKSVWTIKNGKSWAPLRGPQIIIWDLFKFFQTSFVKALKSWEVGAPELLERMHAMKLKRGDFAHEKDEAIQKYCLEECQALAQLGRKLYQAHLDAGIPLKKRFDGPGTSAGVILDSYGVQEKKRAPIPEMREAVACAFFGGRFENSVLGCIEGPLWGYDISSAYPYQQTFLPCLEHGTWTHTHNRADIARAALVRYSLATPLRPLSWGPFPFRTNEGNIIFPAESGGGWVWSVEYLAAEKAFPHVGFVEAWALHSDCDCQPFRTLPEKYAERVRIGKEGKGIALKLGINSCYGKLAQSVGKAQWNCWIWAGMITAGTRAQMLEMHALHKDPANLLAIATDGLYSREKLACPAPRETGTGLIITNKGETVRKPLGGWEVKACKGATFFARPGIYFPTALTADDEDVVRARGIGRKDLLTFHKEMIAACERGESSYTFPPSRRFIGATTGIYRVPRPEIRGGGWEYRRKEEYGCWVPWPVVSSFNPAPKRGPARPDKTLPLHSLPGVMSLPYSNALRDPEEFDAHEFETMILEQNDPGELWDGTDSSVEFDM